MVEILKKCDTVNSVQFEVHGVIENWLNYQKLELFEFLQKSQIYLVIATIVAIS